MRRLAPALITAALAASVLAGCSTDTTTDAGGDASADGFPVSIDHVYGTTTIDEAPERVVTIGWTSQDVVAALGVVPVATTDFTWGSVDKHLPWFAEKVEELGGELPEILRYTDSDEIDAEQVLSLEPDVILAVHSGLTENEYDQLSKIAPVIAYKELAWASDWRQSTLDIGAVLGKADEAQQLLDDADAAIAAQAEAHPEFAGKVFTYGWYLPDGATSLDFYTPADPRVQVVEALGLTTSPQVVERAEGATNFYIGVSLEELETIESDVHVMWADTQADADRTLGNATVARWAPVAAGSYFLMQDQALAWASSQPSVLSIPWSIETVADGIADALAG